MIDMLSPAAPPVQLQAKAELAKRELSRRELLAFTKYTFPAFDPAQFHTNYYHVLNKFATGEIPKLIVTVPPQHGKSEGSTRRLPAFLFGKRPDLKIAIGSYSQTFARKFSREIKRIMIDKKYTTLFPNTRFATRADADYTDTVDERELVGYDGFLKVVGRGGPLTGSPVDIMLIDDLYKDYAEGNSPVIREAAEDWYKTVVRTRLHNLSQQLIVFTRWHEEDLVGYLEKKEKVVTVNCWDDIKHAARDVWLKINFEAIKTGDATELDPRSKGAPLWPNKHDIQQLDEDKRLDPERFESLYQGNPKPMAGLLYRSFDTYDKIPTNATGPFNYTDTADTGADLLCSISYKVAPGPIIYVTDVLYTADPMEITEKETAVIYKQGRVRKARIESNNGGRGFARSVKRIMRNTLEYTGCTVEWFHQSENKESRIFSNSANVQNNIKFPYNWETKWPEFALAIKRYKKRFKANKHDDAPDALTGVWESVENKNETGSSLWEW